MSGATLKSKRAMSIQNESFDPYRLITDEEFQKNMTALLTYYHMLKKESKRRFVSYEFEAQQLVS